MIDEASLWNKTVLVVALQGGTIRSEMEGEKNLPEQNYNLSVQSISLCCHCLDLQIQILSASSIWLLSRWTIQRLVAACRSICPSTTLSLFSPRLKQISILTLKLFITRQIYLSILASRESRVATIQSLRFSCSGVLVFLKSRGCCCYST